jgi:putative SOS response-associated peptidase YedK
VALAGREKGAQLCNHHDPGKELCAALRDRMSVLLSPPSWPAWFGEEPADPAQLKAMLAPYPSDEMTCWPVSSRVGNVKNNDSNLIEPVMAAG